MVKMHGPAFDDSGRLVNRDVPESDVQAYLSAGYVHGSLPEVVVEAEPIPPTGEQSATDAPLSPDLKKLSKAQLTAKAREEGLEVSEEMTRAQLIAAIKELDEIS